MAKRHCVIILIVVLLTTIFFMSQGYALDLKNIDTYLYPEESNSNMEKRISMDFKSAKLNDVLKILSQQSGLNFIATEDVGGKVFNLYFDNVSVEEVLDRILFANNLTYELKPGSNIFVVKKKEVIKEEPLITRIYPLKYATVSSSKLMTTLSSSETGGDSEDSKKDAGGILGAIESLLTNRGSAVEDSRTNSIVVTDVSNNFSSIEKLITRLDVRVPQILIEVEMLDISKSTADLLGAKFGETPISFNGGQKDGVFPFNTDNARDDGGIALGSNQYRLSTLSFGGLAFTLQFLRTQTDTKNLARPRILTLNNTTAEINIKTDEAIGLASTTTSSATGTGESVREAERVETGVFLKVTPQANVVSREITMAIEPTVIEARQGQTFEGQDFKDPEARGSKSNLRIKDGDTIIIGGLLRTDLSNIKTKVPVLGKIPFLGMAFRHKNKTETQRELIIFITPHILKEAGSSYVSSEKIKKIVREQSMSIKRLDEVNKALSLIESQRY